MADESTAPRTATERAIWDMWRELLDHGDFGIDDKFFEIGGSSMHAVLLVSMLDARFPDKVKTADLFERPTVRLIATLVDGEEVADDADGVEL
ncbi:MAG: hypothetical protein Tsb0020_38290 [Haliangiales bacterium]